MKYIIDIPDDYLIKSALNGLTLGIPMLVSSTQKEFIIPTNIRLDPYIEPVRKAIEDEVWEFVRIITDMTETQRKECFGGATCNLDEYMTYKEAKAKYKAWMKQKDEIFNTGDEVWDYKLKSRGVVLRIYNSGNIDILWDDGSAGECIYHKKIHKTGRHFPEVAELLKKMRGDKE